MIHYIIHFLNTNILPIVQHLGPWFYVFVAVVALLESTFIVGTFVPGTMILLFFGYTASQRGVHLIWVIVATVIGAVIGDFISYYIGRYGTGFVKEDRGFLRRSHIEIGRAFFSKHGSMSVLLGRFVSPLRQIIPFIAGAVHMSYRRFFYLNVAGAFLWAIVYVLLGYYFGSNWRLIDKIVKRVGIVITVLLVGVGIYIFHRRRQKRLEALRHPKKESIGELGSGTDEIEEIKNS
jgi:membrane-associated protein